MYNPGNDTSWRAAGSADFSGSLFRSGSYAVCRSLFAVRTRLSLKINGISSRLITLKTKIGAYMTLGAVGTTGMFQSAEALQAAGLATAVVSLWFLSKECLTSFRRKREEGGPASEESEKELLEKALVLRRQGEHHYDMGRKFQNGIGINSDYSRAFQHFYEGAKLGNRECAAELGTFYEYGKGVPRNEFLAQYWYEEGAYGGSGMACYYLARWYLAQERKTPEIRRRAVYFLDEACFNGNVKAQELRGILIQKNTFTDSATEEQLGSATRESMYDYAIHPGLRRYIFRGGTSKPSEIRAAYRILGFPGGDDGAFLDLSPRRIRRAYHDRVRKYHPDAAGTCSDRDREKLEVLKRACELLLKLNS